MATEKEFHSYINTVPEGIRDQVFHSAWGNSWADGCRDEYDSDAHAWTVAIATAEMIVDDPAGFGIEPE